MFPTVPSPGFFWEIFRRMIWKKIQCQKRLRYGSTIEYLYFISGPNIEAQPIKMGRNTGLRFCAETFIIQYPAFRRYILEQSISVVSVAHSPSLPPIPPTPNTNKSVYLDFFSCTVTVIFSRSPFFFIINIIFVLSFVVSLKLRQQVALYLYFLYAWMSSYPCLY